MDHLELINLYIEYLKGNPAISCDHEKFYIIWLEKFLMFTESSGADKIDYSLIEAYLQSLNKNPGLKSWQIRQASKAIACFLEMVSEETP